VSYRAGMVAVVGRASVGKSTLVNCAVGEKVSIVSPVPQTTRTVVRAILSEARGQIAWLDTPGVHKAAHELGRHMNRTARRAVEGTDAVLLVLDATTSLRDEDLGWVTVLARGGIPWLVAANKSDVAPGGAAALDAAIRELVAGRPAPPAAFLALSAHTGAGVAALISRLFELMPEGPALFPEDIVTDFPRRLCIADVVREKLFARLRGEVPHSLAVDVENLREEGRSWRVDAQVYVQRASQRGIVLGKGGRVLKEAQQEAERELRGMFDRDVRLRLWVKVKPDWTRNPLTLRRLGYA
jgi:GTP-binding protein Era